jgi:hypothetical protein
VASMKLKLLRLSGALELTLMLENLTLEVEALDQRGMVRQSYQGRNVELRIQGRRSYRLLLILRQPDMPRKGAVLGEMVPITLSYASVQLKVDRKNLRDWRDSKAKILGMKKGAMRARGPQLEGSQSLRLS